MFVLMVVVEKVNQKGKGLKKFCLPSITTIKRPTNAAKRNATRARHIKTLLQGQPSSALPLLETASWVAA